MGKGKVENQSTPKKNLLWILGPGVITGASDNDPTNIGTFSQVGAQHGFSILWSVLFMFPLIAAIQQVSARIGRVTGRGIAGNMRKYYSYWLLDFIVLLVVLANVINLGADIGAMGAAAHLIINTSPLLDASILAVISVILVVFVPYHRYVSILKWLTVVLFAYIASAFAVHPHWGEVFRATFVPSFTVSGEFVVGIIAILGTMICPYLFFWQASEEVEEIEAKPEKEALRKAPQQAHRDLRRIRVDTLFGMAFSELVAWFIMLTVGSTLHKPGFQDIETAAQAASALEPFAGRYAELLFAVGLIGTGLLAVPVLGGSAAYAVGEALHWPVGLERKPLHAIGFYTVLAISILIGLAMNFFRINPIKALYWSSVFNGVVAGPIMLIMMQMASDPKIMGKFTISPFLKIVGWIATLVMFGCMIGMILIFK